MRWRLDLEYDGSAFAGWQLQPGVRTVQGDLEAAAAALFGHPVRIHGAGRTDAGVHAMQQVAVFDSSVPRTPREVLGGLNAHLDHDVAVLEARVVSDAFDPRREPHRKLYRYRWLDSGLRSPLRRGRVWRVRWPLDVSAMQEAAQALAGTHDFTSFRAAGCTARHPTRTVERVSVSRVDDEVHLEMVGTGFLRHMVRTVAGTLTEIGRGRRAPAWMAEVRDARRREAAGRTAPAHGLCLVSVAYADAEQRG